MQRTIEAPRPPRQSREAEPAIPNFRKLRLSAVVAACAWPRKEAPGERKSPQTRLEPRFEED